MLIRLEGEGALHQRLYRGLRSAICDGRLPPRARLPSTRALAAELQLSRNVVVTAFAQLHAEGFLESRVGSGTYIAEPADELVTAAAAPVASRPPARLSRQAEDILALRPLPAPGQPRRQRLPYDFRYGQPALEEFPHAAWSRLVARQGRERAMRAMDYGSARGFAPLREAVAGYLRRSRGVRAQADQLIIVNGTQQAFDLVSRLLVDRGDRVIVEEPGYQAARQVFLGHGARLTAVPVDDDGLMVSELPAQGAVDPPLRLAYVTPSHQFPLGGVMPRERRLALLRWAERHGAYVLEDDYDSEFRFETSPVEALHGLDRSGRVLYTGSFSKALFPSLRVGYLVVPKELMPAVTALKYLMDVATPTFEQEVLARFIEDGSFERHLRRMRVRYGARRQVLLEALTRAFGDRVKVIGAAAGLHLVIELAGLPHREVPALIERAAARGVGVYPLDPYYQRPPERAALLMGYAALAERDLRAGVQALVQAFDD